MPTPCEVLRYVFNWYLDRTLGKKEKYESRTQPEGSKART